MIVWVMAVFEIGQSTWWSGSLPESNYLPFTTLLPLVEDESTLAPSVDIEAEYPTLSSFPNISSYQNYPNIQLTMKR